ncbi:MAG: guanylate kinase [Bacteroidaceae bacterium]|nr:guanylate kinase [Bacteroidaceae bacterium]
MKQGRIIVFSAPSGSGKSTLIQYLRSKIDNLHFSVSATSRAPRGEEQNGRDYYFLTPEEFRKKIAEDAFIEYEEVYHDKFYGTLRSEVQRQLNEGQNVVLDIDVKGALNVKRLYGQQALLVFIKPPSIETLRLRLEKRGTDAPEVIADRVSKAAFELSFAPQFDRIIVNDDLSTAQAETLQVVSEYLNP